MKTCTRCGDEKPLDEYYRDKSKRGGHGTRCKVCHAEQAAKYYAANREKVIGRVRAHHARHPEKHAEREREYRAEKPHVGWETCYRWRARKFGFAPTVESFTREDVTARYGDACKHCGGPFEHLDHHPVPVALGGHHTLDNVKPSCADCNLAQSMSIRSRRTDHLSTTTNRKAA